MPDKNTDADSNPNIDTNPNTEETQALALTPDEKEKEKEKTLKSLVAECAMSPEFSAAIVVGGYHKGGNLDLATLMEQLQVQHTNLAAGNQTQAENMLMSQAVALQAIFARLALRAEETKSDSQSQTLLGLALRAQNGCRATLETLGNLRNPRQATFVKQANIARGPQQVNNGAAAAPSSPTLVQEESSISANKLSGENHELLEDTRAAGQAITGYPFVAAVEKVHRTKV